MDLKDAISGRRSIRKYLTKQVPKDLIYDILENARFAPSSGNTQCWKVIVVEDQKTRNELAEASLEQMWMSEAPVHLVICNQYKKVVSLYGKLGKMFSIQDCAVFATNIMLLAKSNGLDTCWVGAFEPEKVRKILSIPEDTDPEIILTLGYSNEKKLKAPERKDVKDITFFEKWGSREKKEKPKKILDKLKPRLASLMKK